MPVRGRRLGKQLTTGRSKDRPSRELGGPVTGAWQTWQWGGWEAARRSLAESRDSSPRGTCGRAGRAPGDSRGHREHAGNAGRKPKAQRVVRRVQESVGTGEGQAASRGQTVCDRKQSGMRDLRPRHQTDGRDQEGPSFVTAAGWSVTADPRGPGHRPWAPALPPHPLLCRVDGPLAAASQTDSCLVASSSPNGMLLASVMDRGHRPSRL